MAIDLTGTWHAQYAEVNGEMGPVAHISGIVIKYDAKDFYIHVHGKLEHEGHYSIDEHVSPAQITYVYTKSSKFELHKPRTGIVQLVGSTMKDCLGDVGDPPPKSFNTSADSQTVMTIHQKSGHEGGTEPQVAEREKLSRRPPVKILGPSNLFW